MSRPRSLPDSTVLATVRRLLMEGGEKAVSFASVGADCGLAASTLAQRYKTRDGMVQIALLDGWDTLDARTETAEGATPMAAKAIPTLLKQIGRGHEAEIALLVSQQGDPDLRQRADLWRARVENALAARLE
ncbi:transcriptional regulator, partial [Thioclava sp. BHET1]